MPEAESILKSDSFHLEFLGFGYNALNGVANLALLARIDDIKLGEKLKNDVRCNWEVDEIEFVNIKSEKLVKWLEEKRYNPSSAFAISKAIERLST